MPDHPPMDPLLALSALRTSGNATQSDLDAALHDIRTTVSSGQSWSSILSGAHHDVLLASRTASVPHVAESLRPAASVVPRHACSNRTAARWCSGPQTGQCPHVAGRGSRSAGAGLVARPDPECDTRSVRQRCGPTLLDRYVRVARACRHRRDNRHRGRCAAACTLAAQARSAAGFGVASLRRAAFGFRPTCWSKTVHRANSSACA